jgi:NADPH2:quinone reductase
MCRLSEADEVINYTAQNLREQIREMTGGHGVDVVLDPVGGAYTESVLRSVAWRGRLLVVGFASGEIPRIPSNIPLLKGCSIVGVFWGDFTTREPEHFQNSMEVLRGLYLQGKLRPHISGLFSLERSPEGLRMMAQREVKGKLVVIVDSDSARIAFASQRP